MARLATSGFEIRDHNTVAAEASPDGRSAGTVVGATETTTVRSGSASLKCAGTSTGTSFREFAITAPAAGTSLFARVYVRFSALPSATKRILDFGSAHVSARLTSGGKLQLWSAAGTPAQVGSDSVKTLVVDTWYRVELSQTIGTGATDAAELRVTEDDPVNASEEIVATTTAQTWTDTQPTLVRLGWIEAPGVTSDMFLDDVGVNDSTGTKQNSWAGEGRVALMKAAKRLDAGIGDTCIGASTAADLVTALSTIPLAAHADATNHTTPHQRRSVATSPDVTTFYTGSYAEYGLTGNVIINASNPTFGVGNATTTSRRATSFYLAGTLDYIEVMCRKQGSPTDDFIIEVVADNAGVPGTTVVASAQVPCADLTSEAAGAWVRFAFAQAPLVTGTRYWIVFRRSGANDATNYPVIGAGPSSPENDRLVGNYNSGSSSWADPTPPGAGHRAVRIFASEGASRVAVVQPLACHGEAVSTGTKTGGLSSLANPVIAETTFDYGDNIGAAGTYPTNWRWVRGNLAYDLFFASVDHPLKLQLTKTDGTNRAALCCFLGAYFEHIPPSSAWRQYTKTADSTLWWAEQASSTTYYERSDASTLEVQSGDYALHPDPLPEDAAYDTTLTSITDVDLQAGYTPV